MNEIIWLEPETVIKIHDRQIDEHGGLIGVRDKNLLVSAISCPQNLSAHGKPTIFEMAASLAFGIAKNHPFNDANKRTSYVCTRVFLKLNNFDLVGLDESKLKIMLSLAADEVTETDFAKWLEENCDEA